MGCFSAALQTVAPFSSAPTTYVGTLDALSAKCLGSRRAGLSQRLLNGPRSPPLSSSIVGTQAVCLSDAASERLQGGGHSAPVSIQALIRSPKIACVPGAGSRPSPGSQPQATRSSWAI